MYFAVKSLVVCHESLVYMTVWRILFRFWRRRMETFNCRSTLLLPTSGQLNAYRPKNISLLLNNCRLSKIFFAIRIPSFRSRGEFDAFKGSSYIWNMPWCRDDADLNQKQLITVSTATTSGRPFSVTGFIMVECFHPENFVKVIPVAFHL